MQTASPHSGHTGCPWTFGTSADSLTTIPPPSFSSDAESSSGNEREGDALRIPAVSTFMESSDDFERVDMILEPPPHEQHHRRHHQSTKVFASTRVLGTLGVVAIAFLLSSGGLIGSEPVVASAGPLIGMIGFVVYPLFVTIPYAFIVAELCSAFPEDGGFPVWVMTTFGPFWGIQVDYWSWASGIFNEALLPSVLLRLVIEFYDITVESSAVEHLIKAAIAVALTLPTLAGTRNFGRLCVALCGFVVLAFAVFTIWGYVVAVDFDDLLDIHHEVTEYNPETKDITLQGKIEIDWKTYVNTIFRNYDELIMVSVFGGQVLNPTRMYRRAIFFTMLLMMAAYIVPTPAGLASDRVHWSMLTNDAYPLIAKDVVGQFLQALTMLAAMCSTAVMFTASLYAKSFQLSGMAENVLVSSFLASKTAQFEVPHNAVLLMLRLALPLLSVDYEHLLPITNAFSAAVQLVVIATAFSLRVKLPYIPRPTKVPGGKYMVLLFAVLPAAILCYILYHAFTLQFTGLVIGVSLIPGLACGGWRFYRQRNATTG